MKTARNVCEISAFKASLPTLTFYKKPLLPFSKKTPSQTQPSSFLSQDIYSTNPKQIQKCPVLVRLWQDQWVELFQPKCTEDFKLDIFFIFFFRIESSEREQKALQLWFPWYGQQKSQQWTGSIFPHKEAKGNDTKKNQPSQFKIAEKVPFVLSSNSSTWYAPWKGRKNYVKSKPYCFLHLQRY